MNFDQDAPLNRIKNETQKSHDAFMDYFLMGAGRSLRKLIKRYQNIEQLWDEHETLSPPTRHFTTLGNWATRRHWQARIARQTEIDNEIALEQYRQRHMSEPEALAILADQARGDMGKFANVRSQADLDNHPDSALVKNINQHYNQTDRGEGDRKLTELRARIALGLYDAQKAIELILRYHGSFAADNKRQNLNIDLDKLTDNQLERIAAGEDAFSVISNQS